MLRAVPFDVLVVLGCRVATPLPGAAQRRVERAARAYHEEGATLVIASGGKAWAGVKECELFARGLVERGVPAERVLQERKSMTTRGNARSVLELLRGRDVQRLGLVTCDWHLPRALRLFRRLGMSPIGVPAVSPVLSPPRASARFLRERGSLLLDLVLAPIWPRS
ncbi:MAG TPA: YdcF family protein [Polyangiaceae bacterium]|nr:YdcF family protein [Polyangiaceae bacterium]